MFNQFVGDPDPIRTGDGPDPFLTKNRNSDK